MFGGEGAEAGDGWVVGRQCGLGLLIKLLPGDTKTPLAHSRPANATTTTQCPPWCCSHPFRSLQTALAPLLLGLAHSRGKRQEVTICPRVLVTHAKPSPHKPTDIQFIAREPPCCCTWVLAKPFPCRSILSTSHEHLQ